MKRLSLAVTSVALLAAVVRADDYPQWRGPERTGISKETGLLKQWPKEGLKLLWKVENLGGGYSTPAVAKGRIFLISDRDGKEYAQALDVNGGKEIWSVELGTVGRNRGPQYPGSRATPTVDGDLVFCLGSDGDLACLEVASGKVRWRKNYQKDFEGQMGDWAYSESPLIDGDVLVGTPGGPSATLVALKKNTGETIWKSPVPGGDAAGYASVIVGQVGKVKQYIQFVHDGVVGVDAATGKFLWRDDRTKDPAANIATPVFHNNLVFSGGGRNSGALVQLVEENGTVKATPGYKDAKLATGIGGCVLVGPNLYLTNRTLVCADFATGAIRWQERGIGGASLSYADGHLYLHGHIDGELALVEASPDGYKEKGRFQRPHASKNKAWTHPVVANGRLYIRDQQVLLCYDIKDGGGR